MGSVGQAGQAKAQAAQQEMKTNFNNFQNAMANDRRAEATAQANVNRMMQNMAIDKAAITNYFNETSAIRNRYIDQREQYSRAYKQSSASLVSSATAKLGNLSGGTAQAMMRQNEASRDKSLMNMRVMEETAYAKADNNKRAMLDTRSFDFKGYDSFIPAQSNHIDASSSILTQGILSGAISGVGAGIGAHSEYGNAWGLFGE